MNIWCSVAEFDAVHRQRFTGGGRKRAAGGEGEVHGRDLSSRVHAQEHAGAAGVFANEINGINIFWITLPLWHFAVVCVQELCREIHHKIDVIDEERYNLEMKVNKSDKEVD